MNGGAATIKNYASIKSDADSVGTSGAGIVLNDGGAITNFATGQISNGVSLASGASETVTNDGTIDGTYTTKSSQESSPFYGNLTYSRISHGPSVSLLNGGTATNGTQGNGAAVLTNGIVVFGGAGKVTNSGTISSTPTVPYASHPNYGISISGAAGTVVNQGTISGPIRYSKDTSDGTYIPIVGPSVAFTQGGTVTNGSATNTSATLSNGISITNVAGTVKNFGIISAGTAGFDAHNAIGMDMGGTVVNGSSTDSAAKINNRVVFHGAGTVTNFGTLTGLSFFADNCTLIEEGSGQLIGSFSVRTARCSLHARGAQGPSAD